ncbi:hypothetical protein RJ639_028260 [Escallonia herrerae]|uniref:Uncharacterized protein n=1 Tax=Escallonia herrerae TaxID=1293975 RepID=A0AA88X4Q9_9ASTE|nr:hypothetical protein RJ639_028260 [Escallonia herrerae]
MAYRRRQAGAPRGSTFREEIASPNSSPSGYNPPPPLLPDDSHSSSASSLAAKAIRASSAFRDPSLSSAYGHSNLSPSSSGNSNPFGSSSPSSSKVSTTHEYTSMKNLGEPKQGFWGVLTKKAKAMIDDDNAAQQREAPGRPRSQVPDTERRSQYYSAHQAPESHRKADNPALRKGLDAITSSLTYIGGTIGNALEEGFTIVEKRTADVIQETRKLQIRKKGSSSQTQNQGSNVYGTRQQPFVSNKMQPQMQTDLETQLKASRDVAMAMAAKAKLLLRELKTVKADLAFAKERCAQLEDENRVLRESRGKGDNLEDDDLIRLQLETLLAEKARLAQENSVYARENRFLREIVEYHQLTMQDVVYLDEGSEEVTEVYPIKLPAAADLPSLSTTPASSPSPTPPPADLHTIYPPVAPDVPTVNRALSTTENSDAGEPPSSYIHIPVEEHLERR